MGVRSSVPTQHERVMREDDFLVSKTDLKGRFVLRQLPDKAIELMAYRHRAKDRYIRYPGKVRPSANQKDIRIVLDPSLTKPIEDLDSQNGKEGLLRDR